MGLARYLIVLVTATMIADRARGEPYSIAYETKTPGEYPEVVIVRPRRDRTGALGRRSSCRDDLRNALETGGEASLPPFRTPSSCP